LNKSGFGQALIAYNGVARTLLKLIYGVIFLILGQGCSAKLNYSPLLQAINGSWALAMEDAANAQSADAVNNKLHELRNLVVTIDISQQVMLIKRQETKEERQEFIIAEQRPDNWELRVYMQETPMTFKVDGDTLQWITPDLNLVFHRIKVISQPF
jgi:hypothetical protein